MAGFRTFSATPRDIQRDWHVIDATGQTLGRLATQIATLLRGKHKPIYTPHLDTGDYVIVINAEKFRVTGNRLTEKIYYRHSQYPGGLKAVPMQRMLETHPTRIIEHAVRGMLPKTKLGRAQFKKLRVYAGPTHPHERHLAGLKKQREQQATAAPPVKEA
ncbi:MAG: 50S ribosomal protein L13 [Chloroflexota bacterium]|nr:50S ribosomal protein L13 [Dehalococcoidia bacterium]MDW8254811.1 50S ribosomal protein L13 [Chloroflexota bacterium]